MARTLQDYFYYSQVGLCVLFALIAWWVLKPKGPESQFRVREADLEKERQAKDPGQNPGSALGHDLASSKMKRNEPLQLGGIRIDAAPHEILGIAPQASADQIQKAYREKMKQYHPDKIGRPGSREWEDAQKIAEAINRAKNELLKKAK